MHQQEYRRWLEYAKGEADLYAELSDMGVSEVEDAFYRDLAFGTGGLRGILGAGTNRMNVFTVRKASQGLSDYIRKKHSSPSCPAVAVAYDSRLKSRDFAEAACGVFAANGIKAYIFPSLAPTPCLSFAVRELGLDAGIVITASHNPAEYNGYKVYGADGCQITTEAAAAILREIEKLDIFKDVRTMPFADALRESGAGGGAEWIAPELLDKFLAEVRKQSVLFGDMVDRDVAIVYTPLNGTGLLPVTRVLKEAGFRKITLVKEQEAPDGHFPTCPYPNPEVYEAMALGLQYCARVGADLLLATDPDCDRCGIAVRGKEGYQLLTGNELGLLLLDFICAQRAKHGEMPENPVFVKTIVTTDLAEKIAAHYGVRTINVLTGFKFIGEAIGRLPEKETYICGFEESYGYLTGTYVRDKDGVDAAFMVCEMFAYYKSRNISLLEKLEEIYREYGYCLNTLHSYAFEGSAGMAKMQAVMAHFREMGQAALRSGAEDADGQNAGEPFLSGQKILEMLDYQKGLFGLPKSDVLKFRMDAGSVVIRPSGTEPKLKCYIAVLAEDRGRAVEMEKELAAALEKVIQRA